LAPVDLSLALSIRTPDDRPIRDVKFARELTAAALQSPASEAHVALLRDLPRSADLASEFTALASTLSQSQEPSVRAAGVRAATTALEVAPQVRDSRARGSVTVLSLAVIGASDPELAQRSLPNTRDSGLLAQSQLRLARVIAQKAAAEPDEAAKRTLMASARKLLRSGLAAVPLPREGDLPQPALTEVGPATFAAATVDPEDALTAAERAPHSFARLEALIGCGLAGHLAGSASVESILTKAVAEAQRLPDGESAEVMAARALALQALVQPSQAEGQIRKLTIPWARAGAWMTVAGLSKDPANAESLAAWNKATEDASACRDPEHRAKMIGWALDTASAPAGAFADRVRQSGLPWLIP
jgi:hypothetical protein